MMIILYIYIYIYQLTNNLQSILAGAIHPQHFLSSCGRLGGFLHHLWLKQEIYIVTIPKINVELETHLITGSIEMSQQFAIDKVLGIVDDQHHDGLGYHVPRGLCDDLHVWIDQVPYGLHLTLQLWIGRALLIGRLFMLALAYVIDRS